MAKPKSTNINWGNPITKNLVFNTSFIEGGGSNVKDYVSGVNGAVAGAIGWGNDYQGKVLIFNGTDVLVNYASTTALQILGAFTCSFWVKPTDFLQFYGILAKLTKTSVPLNIKTFP